VGQFSARGTRPLLNKNYAQLGTKFGVAVSFERISSDLKITHTYLHQLNDSRKPINLFEASWAYDIVDKYVALQASYQNGNLESTAQRIQQLLISLAVKY
jgi:hypothetical protein